MAGSTGKTYTFRTSFRAPLGFVFRWCTDYRPSDARLEREPFVRKIISRTARRVVYEDLEETPRGWMWRRHVVTLFPPDRWRSESVGNYRRFVLDYQLRSLPDGRTEMRFRGRRSPGLLATPVPTVRAFARSMERTWRLFGRQLEAEFRGSVVRRRPSGRGRPAR